MHIIEGGPSSTARRDGPQGRVWIRRAVEFKRAFDAVTNDRERMSLAIDFPAIFWAHWMWENVEHPSRWSIEAHILARETNREIAWKNGCGQEVIEAYEAIFFNVREKLNHREYVINTVMGAAIHRGLTERACDLLWKLFGYTGGPHVLDALVGRLVNPLWASRPEDVPAFFQDAALNLMKKQAAVAALTVPVNNHTHLNLIEAFVKYVEIERNTDSVGQAQDQILGNINAMLNSIPFAVGNIENKYRKTVFDDIPAELRSDELLIHAVGNQIPGQHLLPHIQYPQEGVVIDANYG